MKRITTLPLVAAMLLLPSGCGGYGEVSPAAYDYSMALYAISNRQAAEKLDGVSQQITQSRESGDLTSKEARWLDGIVSDAEGGDWEDAASSARRMMEDQVQR